MKKHGMMVKQLKHPTRLVLIIKWKIWNFTVLNDTFDMRYAEKYITVQKHFRILLKTSDLIKKTCSFLNKTDVKANLFYFICQKQEYVQNTLLSLPMDCVSVNDYLILSNDYWTGSKSIIWPDYIYLFYQFDLFLLLVRSSFSFFILI